MARNIAMFVVPSAAASTERLVQSLGEVEYETERIGAIGVVELRGTPASLAGAVHLLAATGEIDSAAASSAERSFRFRSVLAP